MSKIHPTAYIEESVKLGNNVEIGPNCVVMGNVELGDNVRLVAQAHVSGIDNCHTKIGEGTIIYPFASVGTAPQDLKYNNEEVRLEIGKNNTIREHVTINPGTSQDKGLTKIGDNCLFMIGSHIAHDCKVGNNVILANNATLAGHVEVGDFAIIGGLSAIHQFVRIGHHAMIGGMSGIEGDVIPYGSAFGERASLQGLNLIGLKRRNFSRAKIHALRNAFKNIFESEGKIDEKITDTKNNLKDFEEVLEIINFIEAGKNRALCQPKK